MAELSPVVIVILMFVGLLIGLFLGHPLAFVLGGLAVIFGFIGWGPGFVNMFASRVFGLMNNFLLVAIPMFILMANLLQRSGIADGMFESMRYLMGPLRGGLAMAVVLVGTVLAATTGVIGASVTTMGLLALPVMLKHGYDKSLTAGTICAGGTLGILIPPSIMLILMADQSGLSVGKLFLGGLIPGILLSTLYLIYIGVISWLRPELGPALSVEERAAVSVPKRLRMAAVSLVPPSLLIIGVLGSIFTGIATPTEASGVGAFLALLMTIAYRRFNWEMLKDTVITTGKTVSMVMLILVGASVFTGVFLGIGGGKVVADLVMGVGFAPWGPFVMMMLIVFFLGALIDWIGIIFITFPIFIPIAVELGFDPVWFVIVLAVNLQTSFLTPPFGYALFYLKGVASEQVTTIEIYKGVWPFILIMLVGLALVIVFPDLILIPTALIK